jgi:protein involved in polysaccharide export with SLBB domain
MISSRKILVCAAAFFLSAVVHNVFAQMSAVSSSSIQEIQKRMIEQGIKIPDSLINSPQAQSLISKKLSEKDSLAQSADSSDSLNKADLESRAEIQDTSFYEKIIRNEPINPDSILSRINMFGYDVFRRETMPANTASDNISVSSDYLVSPGDEVLISLWGRINEENRLTVMRDGTISLPRIGPVSVGGMPFSQMQENIIRRIQAIEGVQASVSMGALRSITVFIIGEVSRPGQYTLNALSDVTSALFAAGGITKRGSLRTIQIRRNGQLLHQLDYYDFLLSGNIQNSLRLKSGDVLFVPVVKNMAAVAGNVRRSALYEFKGKTTLKDMIDLSGGFTPAAWINRIQVDRFSENRYQVVLDLEAPSPASLPQFTVEDGDIIRVFQILDRNKNTVYLSGNVLRPGKYEFKEGLRVCDIIKSFDDLLPETYFGYAVIQRLEPPLFSERIVSFSLLNALNDASSSSNVVLVPNDNIIIYNRDFFEPDRMVGISGAVTSPGKYRLLDNMRIKDLVLQAGGLTDASSTDRGELYRRTVEKDSVCTRKISFCVQCAMADDSSDNLLLGKLDQVYIRDKRGWEDIRRVALMGEVVFPGEYVLLPNETFGELIRRAGGFNFNAYLEAAVFTRMAIKKTESQRNEEYVRTLESNIAQMTAELAAKEKSEDAQALLNVQLRLLERLKNMTPVGRVVLDLTEPESYENFMLEDGDTLFIPKTMNTVSVMGEVFNPATFQLSHKNSQARHYISSAGGLKQTADKRNVYIVKANGSVISGKKENVNKYEMRPGDVVVAPQKIRYVSGYKVFMETVDAVYKVAMTAAVVLTITNN